MKLFRVMLIAAVLLGGCNSTAVNETSAETKPTETAEVSSQPEIVKDLNGFRNEAAVTEYFEGSWRMLPMGSEDRASENDAKLSFYKNKKEMVFWYESKDNSLSFETAYASLFEEQQVIDLLNLHPKEKAR